jgi:demethylmenaquinone methyltransferase/2-methoxy-6-polyprenyl-1,4-benzoquinol methylase
MEEQLGPIIEIIEKRIIGKKVLEIACGTGNWTEVLAKRAASVVAVDISPAVLKIAKRKLSGCDNVIFIQGDAYNLDCIGDSFDILFSADWWSHIPKEFLPTYLDSSMKKLLPGSSAITIDMMLSEYFQQETCYYDEHNNRISRRGLPDGSEYQVIKNFPGEEEIRLILGDYGKIVAYREFPDLKRWMVMLEKK